MARWRGLALIALALFAAGCAQFRVTDPARSASEQFLLSHAAAAAVRQLSTEALRDRRVFVDTDYYQSIDHPYVLGELRAHLLLASVRLVDQREQAEIILEPRSAGVGIDRYESLLGLPAFVVPQAATTAASGVPNPATLITPELAIMKNVRQYGFAEVAFVAYWADSGELVHVAGPSVGRTHRQDYWFLGFGPRTLGDIPPAELPE